MVLSVTLTFDLLLLLLTKATSMPRPPPYQAPPTSGTESMERPPLCTASAVDYNQLAFFVLANLLTGLVNFSMDTLNASALSALVVLLGYMAVLLVTFLVLHRYHIKIKI